MQRSRDQLVGLMGMAVVRFQDESAAFDEVAARILALERGDLPCMTSLLFGGPASIDRLTAILHVPRAAVTGTVERLPRAGYARRRPDAGDVPVAVTRHGRSAMSRTP